MNVGTFKTYNRDRVWADTSERKASGYVLGTQDAPCVNCHICRSVGIWDVFTRFEGCSVFGNTFGLRSDISITEYNIEGNGLVYDLF